MTPSHWQTSVNDTGKDEEGTGVGNQGWRGIVGIVLGGGCWVSSGHAFCSLDWVRFVLHGAKVTRCRDRFVQTWFLFRVLWGFRLSHPLWLKQILLFVLWQYLEEKKKKKTSGSGHSLRDTYLQHFLAEVYSHVNSVGKPLKVTLKMAFHHLHVWYGAARLFGGNVLIINWNISINEHNTAFLISQRRQKLVNYPAVYWSEANGGNGPLL